MATRSKSVARPGLYSVHPAVAMVQKWVAEMPAKTGRTLDEWVALIRAEGPSGAKERARWLKSEHNFGGNTASWLAERSGEANLGIGEESPEAYLAAAVGYVDAMYAGPKSVLRPFYNRLLELGLSIGPDVKACPCTTMVPLYRNHVFAQIKPTTRTRIDLGFALGDTAVSGRLIDTGGFAKKDRITHRIAISSLDDIDAEAEMWLRMAYERDA